jgi:hypothetical protein
VPKTSRKDPAETSVNVPANKALQLTSLSVAFGRPLALAAERRYVDMERPFKFKSRFQLTF